MANQHEEEFDPALFGEPALIQGENNEDYLRLRAAVASHVKPKSIFDWMMVNDQTNMYWEEQRFKRASVALVEGDYVSALDSLLAPFCVPIAQSSSKMARDYYIGDKEQAREAEDMRRRCGISFEMIHARAMHNVGGSVQFLDRMGRNRETSRRLLRKEHDRNVAAEAAAVRRTAEDDKK